MRESGKDKVGRISKLKAQTEAFPKESFEIAEWGQGQDRRGWEGFIVVNKGNKKGTFVPSIFKKSKQPF